LKVGTLYAFYHLSKKLWNKGGTTTYLKSISVNTVWINYVLGLADTEDLLLSPDAIRWPAMWVRDTEFMQHVEAIMHLIFHDCVKSSFKLVCAFIVEKKANTKFGESVSGFMEEMKALGVDWFKMVTFTTKTEVKAGGWLSEQWFAFAKIIDVVYLHIPPVLPETSAKLFEVGLLQNLCLSTVVLSAFIMTAHENGDAGIANADTLDGYVKYFLSATDNFDQKAFASPAKVRFWRKKGNYPSLLNLVRMMQEYMSIRSLWDGWKERYIQRVNPVVRTNGVRKSSSWMLRKANEVDEQ
jgi:hypothetical protein